MRKLPLVIGCLLVVVLFVSGCQCNGTGRHYHDTPESAAVDYVRQIHSGDIDRCISMMLSCDSASDEYRNVMSVLLKQSSYARRKEGDSLLTVETLQKDVNDKTANVYLKLSYSDNHVENVIVPLVWDGKGWRLR